MAKRGRSALLITGGGDFFFQDRGGRVCFLFGQRHARRLYDSNPGLGDHVLAALEYARRTENVMQSWLLAGVILIHSWYPKQCCGDWHCHPVPCSEIHRSADGNYLWHRGRNDDVMFYREDMQVSQDSQCHVCVIDDVSPAGICLYLAPQT